jgi:hypothetical protein
MLRYTYVACLVSSIKTFRELTTITGQISKSGARLHLGNITRVGLRKPKVSTDWMTRRIIVVRAFQVYFYIYFTFYKFHIHNQFNCVRHC